MRVLNVSANFPCSRAVKMATAAKNHGVRSDALCQGYPPHMEESFDNLTVVPRMSDSEWKRRIAASSADVVHVHGDLGGYWLAPLVREATDKPLLLNVHDLPSDRELISDIHEAEAFACADALLWVTERQRDFAARVGLPIDKPSATVANFVSSDLFIDKPVLPHIGGLCYEGGAQPRGDAAAWRDLSAVADTVPLHIYPGNSGVDYGIVHPTEFELSILLHRMSQHDWNFIGVWPANDAWNNSIPNKFGEGLAAGLPFIALNVPLLEPMAEAGLGICVYNLSDLKKAARQNPKPYKKAVMAQRRQYTMEAHIEPYIDLLRGLS